MRVEPIHHWSSRWGTDRNRALWSGFTVRLPGGNLFFAGDTGYGDGRWAEAAAKHGPYRLAILPVGAYEPRDVMQANHLDPDEAVRVFETLQAEDGARHALGHLPAHLRGDRRPAPAPRRGEAGAGHRGRQVRDDRGGADV